MATCTFGTRVKAGAPATIWFLWSAFLAWLATHFSRLGTIVWVFQPDAPIDTATLCASEPVINAFPSLGDWWSAVAYVDPNAMIVIRDYLLSVYNAALWSTVCECVPNPVGVPGTDYDTIVLADGPVDYWPMNTAATSPVNVVRAGNWLESTGGGTLQTADSICASGFRSINPTCGYDWGSHLDETVSRLGPWSMEIVLKNDGSQLPIFNLGDTGGGVNNVSLFYNAPGAGGNWAIWQGGVTWGDTGHASTQLGTGWHHVVWTYNGSTYGIWVDAVELFTFVTGHGNIGSSNKLSLVNSWCNHGYFGKVAVYDYVLDATQIATHSAATCTPGPTYLPPAPGNPPLPDYPAAPACTTIGDLCTLLQQLEKKVDQLVMGNMFIQTAIAPTGYVDGATSTGLTGTSTLAALDIVGVRVVASIPVRWGHTAETPPRSIPKYGSIQFGDGTGRNDEHQLHYATQIVLADAPFATTVTVNLGAGVIADVTLLQRLK